MENKYIFMCVCCQMTRANAALLVTLPFLYSHYSLSLIHFVLPALIG